MKGKRGVLPGEHSEPALGDPGRDQVTLVEQQQQVLVRRVLLQVVLQELAPGAHRVACVYHLSKM